MQLHPGNKNKFHYDDVISVLTSNGVIGMGRNWENDKGQPTTFSDKAKIGDLVMIHHDGPVALVKITGDTFENADESVWFDIARNIEVLSLEGDKIKKEYQAKGLGDWTEGLYLPSTFQSANESRFIKYWYTEIREKLMIDECIKLLTNNHNLVLTGAPGTGKTYMAKHQLAKMLTGATTDDDSRIGFVQFHPSYDYSDFVEGIKPVLDHGVVTLAVHDGIFKEFCKRAAMDAKNKYVFIIDEINRAELSRVFGELFFGLEESYRGEPINTQYSYLQKKKSEEQGIPFVPFTIPDNVYIIGTMNDIDRSVESMDFALRRRFAWKEITAEESGIIIDASTLDQSVKEQAKIRMEALNNSIFIEMGSNAYQIGGAYFLKLKNYKDEPKRFELLWKNHLEVVLSEYVRGMPNGKAMLDKMKNCYANAR